MKNPTPFLPALIREHQTGDAASTADAVFDALNCPAKWREVFGHVVRDECRRRYRLGFGAPESAPTGHGSRAPQTAPAGGGTPSEARSTFLDENTAVGDGRYLPLGMFTVADHRTRLNMLYALRSGMDATIAVHEGAIAAIEASGASCLYEMDAEVAA